MVSKNTEGLLMAFLQEEFCRNAAKNQPADQPPFVLVT